MKYKLIGKNVKDIRQVFENRGVSPSSILGASEEDVLDPFLLKNMDKAVELVKHHIDHGSTIYVQQDPDADGMTSTAVLVNYLQQFSPETKIVVGVHKGKEHGIDIQELQKKEEEHGEISLVIAPDASSNEHEIHKTLYDAGKDVLVLDHHDAKKYSEHAVMINPQLDDYPNKSISGVGVVQKFARAMDLKYRSGDTLLSDEFYDLVAVGKIADMIEITTPEAVFMVQEGMKNIKNEFLRAIYAKQSYSMKDKITPTGIAFYIAPLMNATTRSATQEEKELVLKAMTTLEPVKVQSTKRGAKEGDTEVLQEQAVRVMSNIKARQDRQVNKALTEAESKIDDSNQIIVVNMEGKTKKEFTGLIANKIMAEYQKPVLVGNSTPSGLLAGSGRTYDKSSLPDLRGFLESSGLVEYAAGHAAAHGFGIKTERVSELVEYANRELKDLDFTPTHLVDFEWNSIDTDFLKEIVSLENYWARGLDEPLFVVKGLSVPRDSIEVGGNFGSRFIKIALPEITLLKFRLSEQEVADLRKNQVSKIDFIGRADVNEFGGQKSLQAFIVDYELVGGQKFYF